ncbi:MAG TPA: holo-ACP synthase [Candidatus Azoamicus sp. OHIO2]
MIVNIGIDVVEKKRIKKIFWKYRRRFVTKILSLEELVIFNVKNDKIEFLSKIFAIKEAIVKALGTGVRNRLSFKNINIVNNYIGKPFITDNEKNKFFLTVSHEKNVVIVMVIIITNLH